MTKWDEKSERDLLLAIRVAENGYNAVSKETWVKATRILITMGYADATWTGISQRWSKVIQKNFQSQYPNALEHGGAAAAPGTAAAVPAPAPALTPTHRQKQPARRRKREPEPEQEEQVQAGEVDDEDSGGKAPAAKRQKKN